MKKQRPQKDDQVEEYVKALYAEGLCYKKKYVGDKGFTYVISSEKIAEGQQKELDRLNKKYHNKEDGS